MSDRSTQTTAADTERNARRELTEHYISAMRPSAAPRSLLGALAFVCALVGPIAVRAEVVSVPSTNPPNPAASPSLPTVVRGSPPSTARSVPVCPPGYTASPDYDYRCIRPSGGDHPDDGQSPSQILAQSRTRALARFMSITQPP